MRTHAQPAARPPQAAPEQGPLSCPLKPCSPFNRARTRLQSASVYRFCEGTASRRRSAALGDSTHWGRLLTSHEPNHQVAQQVRATDLPIIGLRGKGVIAIEKLRARLMSGGPVSAGILKPRSSFHARFPLVFPVWSPGARHSEHLYPGADSSRVVACRPVWRLN